MAGLDIQYISDLVLQAQEGDSNAFAELFAATYPKQYAFALRYLREDFPAQRALQSAYTQALGSITKLREPALFVVWLNQLTLRACLLRDKDDASAASCESRTLRIDGAVYSIRQILTLPFSESQTLLLQSLCGMRVGAIAALLEMSRSDVRRHIASGRRRIRALAAAKGGDRP